MANPGSSGPARLLLQINYQLVLPPQTTAPATTFVMGDPPPPHRHNSLWSPLPDLEPLPWTVLMNPRRREIGALKESGSVLGKPTRLLWSSPVPGSCGTRTDVPAFPAGTPGSACSGSCICTPADTYPPTGMPHSDRRRHRLFRVQPCSGPGGERTQHPLQASKSHVLDRLSNKVKPNPNVVLCSGHRAFECCAGSVPGSE